MRANPASVGLRRGVLLLTAVGLLVCTVRWRLRTQDHTDNGSAISNLRPGELSLRQGELEQEDSDDFGSHIKGDDRQRQERGQSGLAEPEQEKAYQPLHERFGVEPEPLDEDHETHGKSADIDAFRSRYSLLLDPASSVILDQTSRLFFFSFGNRDGEAVEWLTRRVPHGKDFTIYALEADEDGYRSKFEKRLARMQQTQTQGDHWDQPLDKRLSAFWGLAGGSFNGTCARPGPGSCVDVVDFIGRRVRPEDYVVAIIAQAREPIDSLVSAIALRSAPPFYRLVDELFLECELGDDPIVHADCMILIDWLRSLGIYTHEWRSK